MNIGKFCPLPLFTLIGNFRIHLYIVSLVVILSNGVCDVWVYRFPSNGKGGIRIACQYIVSPRGRTGNRTVTQMRHPFLFEGRPNCARQSLASTLSAPCIAATSYCDPGRHANVITLVCFSPCLMPNRSMHAPSWELWRSLANFGEPW